MNKNKKTAVRWRISSKLVFASCCVRHFVPCVLRPIPGTSFLWPHAGYTSCLWGGIYTIFEHQQVTPTGIDRILKTATQDGNDMACFHGLSLVAKQRRSNEMRATEPTPSATTKNQNCWTKNRHLHPKYAAQTQGDPGLTAWLTVPVLESVLDRQKRYLVDRRSQFDPSIGRTVYCWLLLFTGLTAWRTAPALEPVLNVSKGLHLTGDRSLTTWLAASTLNPLRTAISLLRQTSQIPSKFVPKRECSTRIQGSINPFSTAVPFWGQTTINKNLYGVFPKGD